MIIRMRSKIRTGIGVIVGCTTAVLVTSVCLAALADGKPCTQKMPVVSEPTADHSKFEIMNRSMNQGPDATKACLSCHTDAAKQVQKTIHWTWGKDKMGKEGMGKAYVINNY